MLSTSYFFMFYLYCEIVEAKAASLTNLKNSPFAWTNSSVENNWANKESAKFVRKEIKNKTSNTVLSLPKSKIYSHLELWSFQYVHMLCRNRPKNERAMDMGY